MPCFNYQPFDFPSERSEREVRAWEDTYKKCRNKEENSSKEDKRDIRLELGTASASRDAMPVPDVSAIRTNIFGEKTKSYYVACEQEEVHGPVNKG